MSITDKDTLEGLRARVAELEALLEQERQDSAQAQAFARDAGYNAALSGVHDVFVDEDRPIGDFQGDKPFCRIQMFYDGGDGSVGIPSRSYWALLPEQKGTELEDLMHQAGVKVES